MRVRRKCILIICVLVMCMSSIVYADEEENQEIYYSENIVEDGIIEEWDNEEIDLLSTTSTINWKIKPTVIKSGPEFSRKKGDTVKIRVKVSPHKKIRVGIRGTYTTYIETTSTGTATFTIKEKGKYRFFVENKSDSTVQVTGTYSK